MTKTNDDGSNPLDAYVQLDRKFNELSWSSGDKDEDAIDRAFRVGKLLGWPELNAEYRVVILAEAGTGKTKEILENARRLRAENKPAFFLRLENVVSDFELAFEVGTLEEFEAWHAGADEGWVFLDSVDEARLKSFNDFELAIKKMGKKIGSASERAHIVVTGRGSAWRPVTDLRICTQHFPKAIVAEHEKPPEEFDFEEDDDADAKKTEEVKPKSPFKIVTLSDLNDVQIAKFVASRGVTDTQAFLDEVERADAAIYTTRPQDLQELAAFWNSNGRIGSRLELMKASVARRLEEPDKARAEAKPLSTDQARFGAQLLAAATTFARQPNIRVTDGQENQIGLLAQDVLKDWAEPSLAALLLRPIFDQPIYEAVRFHHRSVREYLAAEWLAGLLARQTSRRAIEALIFREAFGMEVVAPAMRPILPWLAILDEKIRDRLRKVAPEVLLEGGDPSSLPRELRSSILATVCAQIADGQERRSTQQRDAVQRFATSDLTPDVVALLEKHKDNEELRAFLLRMVWLGRMKGALPQALAIAVEPNARGYTRITAFRAVAAIGAESDMTEVRKKFAGEVAPPARECLAELIDGLPSSNEGFSWLMECLAKYSFDELGSAVAAYMSRLSSELFERAIEGLNKLLSEPPVTEKRYCAISERFGWLMPAAAKAVERAVLEGHASALRPSALDILNKLNAARGYQSHEVSQEQLQFTTQIPNWLELNRALFWHDVEAARPRFDEKDERITEAWQASIFGSFWRFVENDFDYMIEQIRSQPHQDNKLVALSVAFELYRTNGRTVAARKALKCAAAGNEELLTRLKDYLKPPANPQKARYRDQERKWKARSEAQQAKRAKNLADSIKYLQDNLEMLIEKSKSQPGVFFNSLGYLFEKAREGSRNSSRWTEYNWRTLIPTFGDKVATHYRDSAVGFWRHYKPVLRSEGYPADKTANNTMFGLVGIEIESREIPSWLQSLSADEITLACRYASFELNGFPPWFPKLFAAFPHPVSQFLLQEIDYELANESPTRESNYVLSDVSWAGQWAWNELAPHFLSRLAAKEPASIRNLQQLLTVVQGSNLPDEDVAKLAEPKCGAGLPPINTAIWFSVWVGADAEVAIPALKAALAAITDQKARTDFAMHFVTNLLGERRQPSGVRQSFATPTRLKELYLIIHEDVRREDDIERAGKGAYSPGLRDNAQDARNALFEVLLKIPGKETFLAVQEVADRFPNRPWLRRYAVEMAESECDLEAWSPQAVREFHDKLEKTPTTHAELAGLAVLRFLDLKDELENGDTSIAKTLQRIETEPEMRAFLGKELRDKADGRYSVPQEEELADGKKPDIRFHGVAIDNPVPVELKLADSSSWSGPKLFKHMEEQLGGDYLRDKRSTRGLFVLVNRGNKTEWHSPTGEKLDFDGLCAALQSHWKQLAPSYPNVDDIVVVGIDLTKRGMT